MAVGEFLALLGAFQASIPLTALAALGLILASVYSLWVIQKVFHGEVKANNFDESLLSDLGRRELVFYAAMILGLVWMGMYPQSFLNLSSGALNGMLEATEQVAVTVTQVQL